MKRLLMLLALVHVGFSQNVVLLDGEPLLVYSQFIKGNASIWTFGLENRTSYPWTTLRLEFNVEGSCNGIPTKWTFPVVSSIGWTKERSMTKQGHELVIPLVNKVDGCSETSTEVRLLTAENYKIRFDGKQWMDLDKERQAVLDRLDRVVEENRKKREIKAAEQKEIQAMNLEVP